MARLMIKCPNTGLSISTGIDMDQVSFDGSTLIDNAVGCSACRETHIWQKKDAFLEERRKKDE